MNILDSLVNAEQYVVALSGGLDSVVLLHALKQSHKPVRAVHVHHGLSPFADEWQTFCERVCEQWEIPLSVERLNLSKTKGHSLEALARVGRYQVLANAMDHTCALLTAHHMDDQAETVLLQLCRGSGLAGLSAMPEVCDFADGLHCRPLLNKTREQLEQYAHENKLVWINDESNHNQAFDRNYVRHTIMPLLQQRWPSVAKTFSRTARHCATALALQQELWQECLGATPNTLSVSKLNAHHKTIQKTILHQWLHAKSIASPSETHLDHICENLLKGASSKNGVISWADIEVRRYQDNLHCLSKQNVLLEEHYDWDLSGPLILPHCELHPEQVPGTDPVQVQFRKGGERVHPKGRIGSHPLKKCMQEWQIPPWERAYVPLIYRHEQLIMVYGYCVCDSAV